MTRAARTVAVAVDGEPRWPGAIEAAARQAVDAGLAERVEIGPGPADFTWALPADAYPAPSALCDALRGDGAPPRMGALLRTAGRVEAVPRFATVVVRTRGDRLLHLEEALTCLAGQSADGFDVMVASHTDDAGAHEGVRALVASFEPGFAARVTVVEVPAGHRGRPLNAGLALVTGAHVAFLDDDDLVTAEWMEAFQAGAAARPGAVVRSRSTTQPVRRAGEGYEAAGEPEARFDATFDLRRHLVDNSTPIFSYAVPADLAADGLRFDEELPVLEDWDFLMHAVLRRGVVESDRVTGTYHWWVSGESSLDTVGPAVWADARRRVHARLDGLTEPRGEASRLAAAYDALVAGGRSREEAWAELTPPPATLRRRLTRLVRRT